MPQLVIISNVKYEIPATPFAKTLKKAGMRVTAQRVAIYQLLIESKEHPSAAMLYEQLKQAYPTLSLMTVYNTLNRLVQIGAIHDLGTLGDGYTHYDGDISAHVNLACTACNKIIDMPSEHTRALASEIDQTSGFQILGSRLLYYGLCPSCR